MHLLVWLLLVSSLSPAQTVSVPGGELRVYWAARKEGEPPIVKKINAFRAQAHAVTNAEFLQFLRAHPEWRKSKAPQIFVDEAYLASFQSDLKLVKGARVNAPVTSVSYFAAQAYCGSIGMGLPTTEQWEYMAMASESKKDASGDTEFLDRILEWYAEPKPDGGLPPVQRRPPNLYGLYDLHGLIWEWVEDFNSNLVTGESREDGSANRNLFCGGGGGMDDGNKENYAAFMRFAFRSSLKGKSTAWNLGFRCVKEEN